MRYGSHRDSFGHLAPGPSLRSPFAPSFDPAPVQLEYDDGSTGKVGRLPELKRLAEQKEPSLEAVEIAARVREIAGDSKVTCAWIIDLCLPEGARELLEVCAYSLRDEVYHWLQKRGVRIVGKGEYELAVRATVDTRHAVRPLREALKKEFGWVSPPPEAKSKKGAACPPSPPSVAPSAVLFDLPPAPEPAPAPAIPSAPPAPAKIEVPGKTEEIRGRRRRIIELLQDRGRMSYRELCRAIGAEESVMHSDLRTLVRAGLVEFVGERGAYNYKLKEAVTST